VYILGPRLRFARHDRTWPGRRGPVMLSFDSRTEPTAAGRNAPWCGFWDPTGVRAMRRPARRRVVAEEVLDVRKAARKFHGRQAAQERRRTGAPTRRGSQSIRMPRRLVADQAPAPSELQHRLRQLQLRERVAPSARMLSMRRGNARDRPAARTAPCRSPHGERLAAHVYGLPRRLAAEEYACRARGSATAARCAIPSPVREAENRCGCASISCARRSARAW